MPLVKDCMHLPPPNHGDQQHAPRGTVMRLWRYPVKSMLGEQQAYLEVNARGVEGDRQFAIRTAEGKFGSGKSTRRFRYIDGLFGYHATYHNGVPEVTFPDGQIMRGDDPAIHTVLSTTLGQPVTLAPEAAISHLDAGPVHVLTTAALAWLRVRLPDAVVDDRRFRPNLLIDVPGATQVEHQWCDRTLAIGETVRVRISVPTQRCGMVGFAQADVPKDAHVLQCITHDAAVHFGVYADVLVPGRITLGDQVLVID